ncbi:MAG: rod shape-determining protein RodA [Lachnospiraceae bacterium]|nr:rod shape-determining protein RodA [Lachnospiraceae bacterium]
MTKIIETLRSYKFRHFNIRLLIWVCALTVLGILVISSATDSDVYEKKQILGFGMGLFIAFFLSLISYKFILKFYWIFYFINLVLLLWVKFSGSYHMGATRWIDLGFFQLQPSELTKIFLILFFAFYLDKYKDKINTFKVIGSCVILFVIPLYLVLSQPDLSTSIVISLIFCGIMYVSGLSYKFIGGVLAVAVPIVIVLVYLIMQPDQHILQGYQLRRITSFYDKNSTDPDVVNDRRQQENSVMAIGSGGLYGKGLNNNTTTSLKNGNYLSEPQTDFIFCIVGEELGFIGTAGVIILLFLISIECFLIGAHAPDLAGRIIATGYGVLIVMQSFVNISVVTMLLPNTGLPLPFVSYGLSSIVSLYFGLGVVLNVSLQRKQV